MSYLDRPRINFAGSFQASPATINNTPNNYDPARYTDDALQPAKIELYWEPKGDSIFNLINCAVTTVEAPGSGADPLVGTAVLAVNTGSPPKLVDLDPMQQNGSEIWGLTVRIGGFGGAWVQGTFTPIAFNGIWINSQGAGSPQSSSSASAVYQSTLTDLSWNVGGSATLQALQAASPNRLSIRMVVSAHNNAPQFYAFTDATFATMQAQGVSAAVLLKITSLKSYAMNRDAQGTPSPATMAGFIPTLEYVNYLLDQLLGPSTGDSDPRVTILSVAKQPYNPWGGAELPFFDFNYGKVVGSVGPCLDDEPGFVVPARTLAPPLPPPAPAPPPMPVAFWAQAKLDADGATPSLTIDLANSLPVSLPGRPLSQAILGTLSLATYTVSGTTKTYTNFVDSIDYADPAFIDQRSGILVVPLSTADAARLANLPIALRSTTTTGGTVMLLEENVEGLSMRADQFIYRMNPGMATTPTFGNGGTNSLDVYVRKFGSVTGTDRMQISFNVLSPSAANTYTQNTLGTGPTNGIAGNISTPTGVLQFAAGSSAPFSPSLTAPVVGGKSTVTIQGGDPGNPRRYVDGQIYFATYAFSQTVADYYGNPDDLVSVQVYQQTPIAGTPTWQNGIGDILRQYGMLYPIMGRFQLWTYGGVVENNAKIKGVLSLDVSQPMHMPVTRDLSTIRCNLILGWFNAGMPYGPVGPVGGPGTSWNNLPAVSGLGPMTSLVIRSGEIIDAIQPIYGSRPGPQAGGNGGAPTSIDLTNDAIVSMTGYTGVYYGAMQVAQLTFTTASGKIYGPFGSMGGVQGATPFENIVPAGGAIRSFFGTTFVHTGGTTYIASLGANVQAP